MGRDPAGVQVDLSTLRQQTIHGIDAGAWNGAKTADSTNRLR